MRRQLLSLFLALAMIGGLVSGLPLSANAYDDASGGSAEQLYLCDPSGWWFDMLPAGDNWHGYFTMHAEEQGEKLWMDSYEFETTSGTTQVKVTLVTEDPGEEGLTFVDGLYHVEVEGVGSGVLSVTVGDAVYAITVTVEGEPERTDTEQLYLYDAWYDWWFGALPAGDGWHGYFTMHAEECGEKLWMDSYEFETTSGTTQVKVTLVTEDPGEEGLTFVDGLYHVEVEGVGSGVLSVTVGDTVYAITVTVEGEPERTDTEQLYLYDAWYDCWFGALPAGDGWHGYFTMHAEEQGEKLWMDSYEFETTSGTTQVKVTLVTEDPGEEGLTFVDGLYHVEVEGVGSGVLSVTVGDTVYAITVTVEGEPERTDTEQLYLYDAWYDCWFGALPAGDGWHGYFTMHAEECGEKLWMDSYEFETTSGTTQVKVTLVTEDPGEEGLTFVDGLYHVEVEGVGSGVLSVTVGDTVYAITVTVEGEPERTDTEQLYLYDAWYDCWFGALPAGDGWHGYFTMHAEECGEKLWMDSYEFETTSGTTQVKVTLVTEDPGEEGLTFVDGLYHVEVEGVGSGVLSVTVGDTVYAITVTVEGESEEDGESPTITVNEVVYTVGLGDSKSNNEDSITFLGRFSNLGCYPGFYYVIAAMSDAYTPNQAEAPYYVYQYIKDVGVELVSYTNMDSDGDQAEPNCSFSVGTVQYHGATLYTVEVNGAEGEYFISEVRVSVTVQGPDQSEPETYSWVVKISYTEDVELDLDASELDTAEKLNAVLASEDAFYAWMETKDAQAYQKLMAAVENDLDRSVRVFLPAVVYEDVIVANVSNSIASIVFFGSFDEEKQTTMPGMQIGGIVSAVWRVNFVADSNCTQSYDNETFTCGILISGNADYCELLQTEHCTFTGFDYGVRSTDDGIAVGVYGCKFTDCTVAYYMDSYDSERSQMYGAIYNTRFVNSDSAIQIVSLYKEFSAYAFRVNDCDFISNGVDFDVDNSGNFYFYRNYYGVLEEEEELSVDNIQYRTAAARYQYVENGTIVVTNPRRIVPCTFDLGDNRLCIDPTPGLYTMILNSMADELIIDGASLENMEGEAEITVSDEKEEEVGKWKFNEKEETTNLMTLAADADGFNASLYVDRSVAGQIAVTVVHSSVLETLQPEVSIPCDDTFADAMIFVNGIAYEAAYEGGYAFFSVAKGGTFYLVANAVPTSTEKPTCVEPGRNVYVLNGVEYTETLAATGHDFTDTSKETCANCAEPNPYYGYAHDALTPTVTAVETDAGTSVTVTVTNTYAEERTVRAIVAAYDQSGKLLCVKIVPEWTICAGVSEAASHTLALSIDGVHTVRVFLLDDNWKPLSEDGVYSLT